jgi:NAD(P)-dependent dehydrogenase (short-subunit alcohol dehydrogenase family)
MSSLNGKVALILGASTHGGIGEATARAYQQAGAKLVLSARRLDACGEIARAVGGTALSCDVTKEAEVAALVASTVKTHGRLDVALVVAGGHANEPFDAMQADTLRRLFELNVVGPMYFIKHCARAMQPGASIIVVTSHSAQLTTVGVGAYGCTKAAAERLVEVAAFEYSAKGIRVNSLSPSMVETPMSEPALKMRAGLREGFERETPLGRLANVDEIAAGALWLADDKCFTTGDVIRVGGGIHLRRFPAPSDFAPRRG